MSMLMPDL